MPSMASSEVSMVHDTPSGAWMRNEQVYAEFGEGRRGACDETTAGGRDGGTPHRSLVQLHASATQPLPLTQGLRSERDNGRVAPNLSLLCRVYTRPAELETRTTHHNT